MSNALTHGASVGGKVSRLYSIWRAMKSRCHLPNAKSYHNYGARGIAVCDLWRKSFIDFQCWSLANGYADTLQIDRIKNNSGYSPENCRWVTAKTNIANRRNSVILPSGETTVEVGLRLGMSDFAIRHRLKTGMPPALAMTLPKCGRLGRDANGQFRKRYVKESREST